MTEQAAGEDTFISHLVELRDRLVKASIGIAIVCAALMAWPGPSHIYDLIAAPMIASMPPGSTMIATGVISPFLVPMKVTLLLSFTGDLAPDRLALSIGGLLVLGVLLRLLVGATVVELVLYVLGSQDVRMTAFGFGVRLVLLSAIVIIFVVGVRLHRARAGD